MGDSPVPAAIKHLGQNFLIDPNIVRKIISLAELSLKDSVLEIGPGRGILTDALCQSAGRVTAIEIDSRLHTYLTERPTQFQNLTLVLGDAMAYPLEQLPVGTIVVSNLPYYLSTPLLFRLLEQQQRVTRLVLMLQNEVADRLVAKSGSSDYGVLSVMAQYSADITKAFKVSPQCFRPRPDVDSAVVLLRTKGLIAQVRESRDQFAAIVRAAFAHRRKTLVNSLRDQGYDQQHVVAALTALHLSLSIRAENLSLDKFIALTQQIHGSPHSSRLRQLDQLS